MNENRYIEFKREVNNTFLKTVSAFANYHDGEILFGVDDSGIVVGLEDPKAARLSIEHKINDCIEPIPDFKLTEEDGIIRLLVKKGDDTPYLYNAKAYRRSDTSTVEVGYVELRRLLLKGMNLRFEDLECGKEDLRFSELEAKMREELGINDLTDDILRTLGFYNQEGKLNNAAAIFADENNLPGIDMVRFGRNISEFLDRETISNVSALTLYDSAVKMYQRYYQYETIKGIVRETEELIPESAFREAIANALVHRSWDMNSHIRVSMFDDHIEINSPGGLPEQVTADDYLTGQVSYLRNQIMGTVFSRLGYIELLGTGVKRILEAYQGATRKPQFTITPGVISVKLPILRDTYDVTTDEKILIDALSDGSHLASSELSERTGFSKAKTIRTVNVLKENGFVYCTGKGRATKYYL